MKQIFTKLIPKSFALSLNGKSAEILYDKAEKLHKKANELFKLGYNHPKEYNAAFELYKKAAEQGLAEAQCKLGVCYYYGKGIKKSSSEAIKWYQKAIEKGNAEALYYLGRCYYDGKGVFKNYSQAVEYMKKAATLGYAKAQYELSMCYYYGNGVENYDTALKWFQTAAEQGSLNAKDKLIKLGES